MDTFWQDLRYGMRMLMKHPGFTAVAVVTLALGIGANTAIFSLVNAVLLRPLPYPDPDRLMHIWETSRGMGRITASVRDYVAWRSHSQAFEQMGAYRHGSFTLTGGKEPEQVPGLYLSSSLFAALGVSPALGRAFLPAEEQPGAERVVVVSHGLWQRRFSGDPKLLGQTLTLDDRDYTVVGIMPAGFEFPIHAIKTELWVPLIFQPAELERGGHNLFIVGRLEAGITRRQAQAEMEALQRQLDEQRPATSQGLGARVVPLDEEVAGDVRFALLVLLGAVSFVLLVACANVANLLLARASARQKEIAIRATLGARRWRLARQLLTESLLLAMMGGAAGLLLAFFSVDLLAAISPVNLPRVEQLSIDGRVLAFTLAVSLLTGLVFGLAPALQASRIDLNESLKEGGHRSTAGAGGRRVGNFLVVTEVALALMLLAGAGLMIKSFLRLSQVDSGIDPQNVLTASLTLSSSRYRDARQQAEFYRQVLERVRALPEVQAAGVGGLVPLSGGVVSYSFTIPGRAAGSPEARGQAGYYVLSPGYFRALGITLLRGRDFTEQDREGAPPVAIINQSMARRFWPDRDPLGEQIEIEGGLRCEIVGIVQDIKSVKLEAESQPEMYTTIAQSRNLRFMRLYVRTTGDPLRLVSAVQREVLAVNPDQPLSSIKTMEQMVAESVAHPRFRSLLLGLFAAVASALASVGLYGVMSYQVAQRTHEIGIRLALGAQASDVLRLVVGHGMALVLVGIGVGLAGSLALTRLLKSLLFGVTPTDPMTFVGVTLLLTAVALLASYIPARRATRVYPMVALRYE